MTDETNIAAKPFPVDAVETADIEAPFIWAIKIPSLQSMILTVRANSAADLAERIDALSIELPKITADTMAMIDHVVASIRARAPEAPQKRQDAPQRPIEHPNAPAPQHEAPAPQAGKKQPSGQKPKKTPSGGSSERQTESADDDGKTEGTMTAVRIEVLHNDKNHKNYLGIWDHKRAGDKYPPMSSYLKPAALASLFSSGNWSASDFESPGIILEQGDDPVKVEWKAKKSGDKMYYNPTKIHM